MAVSFSSSNPLEVLDEWSSAGDPDHRSSWRATLAGWSPSQPLPALLFHLIRQAISNDRPDLLEALNDAASHPIDWSAIPVLTWSRSISGNFGNLLCLAAWTRSEQVVPWLLRHGVSADGAPTDGWALYTSSRDALALSDTGARRVIRPWEALAGSKASMLLNEDQELSEWSSSYTRRWLSTWLDEPKGRQSVSTWLQDTVAGRAYPAIVATLMAAGDVELLTRFVDAARPDPDDGAAAPAFAQVERAWLTQAMQQAASLVTTLMTLLLSRRTSPTLASDVFPVWAKRLPELTKTEASTQLGLLVEHGLDLHDPDITRTWAAIEPALASPLLWPALEQHGWQASSCVERAAAAGLSAIDLATLIWNTWTNLTPTQRLTSRSSLPTALFNPDGGALTPFLTTSWWTERLDDVRRGSNSQMARRGSRDNSAPSNLDVFLLRDLMVAAPPLALPWDGLLQQVIDHRNNWQAHGAQGDDSLLQRWLARFAKMPGLSSDSTFRSKIHEFLDLLLTEERDHHGTTPSLFLARTLLNGLPNVCATFQPALDLQPTARTVGLMIEAGWDINPEVHDHDTAVQQWFNAWVADTARFKPVGINLYGHRRASNVRSLSNLFPMGGLLMALRHLGVESALPPATYRHPLQDEGEPLLVALARNQLWSAVGLLLVAGGDPAVRDREGRNVLTHLLHHRLHAATKHWAWHYDDAEQMPQIESGLFQNAHIYKIDFESLLEALVNRPDVLMARGPGRCRTIADTASSSGYTAWYAERPALRALMEQRCLLDRAAATLSHQDAPVTQTRARL